LISLAAGRVNEWTVRLPSAIFAILGVLGCYYYVRKLFDARSGLFSALILATSIQYLQAGAGARVDMTLSLFLEVAFFEFIAIAEGLSKRPTLLFAAIACAVLTKGPIGLALPVLVAACWLALMRRRELSVIVEAPASGDSGSPIRSVREKSPPNHVSASAQSSRARVILQRLKLGRGVLIVGIVAGGWYLAALAVGGLAFAHKQLLAENLYRLLGHRSFPEAHRHAFYYIEGALAAGFMPWTPVALLAAIQYRWWPCKTLADRGAACGELSPLQSGVSVASERIRRFAYLLVWFAVVLIFFNFPQSKRGVYLLPLYPALSALIAVVLAEETDCPLIVERCRWWFSRVVGLFFIVAPVCAIVAVAMLFWWPARFERLMAHFGILVPSLPSALLACAREHRVATAVLPSVAFGVGVWLLSSRVVMDNIVVGLIAGMTVIALAVNLVIEPAIADTLSLKEFASQTRIIAGSATVGYFGSLDYAFAFYSGRNIQFVSAHERALPGMIVGPEEQWPLMPPSFRSHYHVILCSNPTELDGSGQLLLLRASDYTQDQRVKTGDIERGGSDR
jgi:4-amino-4-deoxy-L-arabinose transferase-like glycosyltransferase